MPDKDNNFSGSLVLNLMASGGTQEWKGFGQKQSCLQIMIIINC